jgi:hypothetical protein
MTLRANLNASATRWPTIMVLITSGLLLALLAVMVLSIPAMLVGAADLFVSWLPYLSGIMIGATVLSAIVLQRRMSSDVRAGQAVQEQS